MKLIWHGHSCFTLECQDGIVVFDPYKNHTVPGLKNLSLQANVVLCSHEHSDHHGIENVEIIEHKQMEIDYIDSYHDQFKGEQRGQNRIYIVQSENMKVVHMGDQGCLLDDYRKIEGCDVLLTPIGGYYTINSQEALKMIELIQPRLVIPMHYRSEQFGYEEIETIECFMKEAKHVIKYQTNSLIITKDTPQQVAILKC